MIRELQVTMNKPANAMYKSGEEKIITGMAVVKNETNKTFEFPTEETASNLFFVDKERIPTGSNCARVDMSDYDEDFVKLPRDNKEVWNGSYFLDTTSKQMYWYSEKTQDWST